MEAGKTGNGEKCKRSFSSVRIGGKNPKSVWWRKEAAWKWVLAASNEGTKERCMEVYREEKRRERLKGV